MSSLNLRRIARAEILRTVSFEHLISLLDAEGGTFVIAAGLDLTVPEDAFDFSTLAHVLANPAEAFPAGLADALHHIHEMADEEGMELLIEAIGDRGILEVGDEVSPADVALQLWLADRELLVREHAKRLLFKTKRYETYRGAMRPMPSIDEAHIEPIRLFLNGWFEAKKEGCDCVRITHASRGDTTWLMIRHGLAMDQRAVIKGGRTERRVDRPEKYDVISYVAKRGELSVHTTTKGECEAYRKAIGEHLFGDANHFHNAEKFTFEPLALLGEDALVCDDVEGIDNVTLREAHFRYGGENGRDVIHRAKRDLFASWGEYVPKMDGKVLRKVGLMVTFADSAKPRAVKIELPHVTNYSRDSDEDLVNAWLEKRGFIIAPGAHAGA